MEDTIIWKKMPTREGEDIMASMLNSNSMIKINITITTDTDYEKSFDRNNRDPSVIWRRLPASKWKVVSITINSITPIIPKYEVGDKVRILATGEIGEVEKQCYPDTSCYRISFGNTWRNYYWSAMCKLPK